MPEPGFFRCYLTLRAGEERLLEFDVQAAAFTTVTATAAIASLRELDVEPANDADVEETRMVQPVRGELSHGAQFRRALASDSPAQDLYLVRVAARSSYEVVLDELSGDLTAGSSPVQLVRLGPDTVSVQQFSAAAGTGPARMLRWQNSTDETVTQMVRVQSQGCSTDCGPDDTYRLRAYRRRDASPASTRAATRRP